MRSRWPLVPTTIVALAVLAMIGLGVWQLQRRAEKEAYLARVAANAKLPVTAFPTMPDEAMLLRRATAMCLDPGEIRSFGAGDAGYRLVAECRTGAEGPGMLVQLGTTRDPKTRVAWPGGRVTGFIGAAPDGRSLIGRLFDNAPQRQILVLEQPIGGLGANRRPDIGTIPNNHLAYAVQWFLFAGLAAIIYVLALRRRGHASQPPPAASAS
jgi:surfeit locus 1 family protein